jgi:hypothetical protein
VSLVVLEVQEAPVVMVALRVVRFLLVQLQQAVLAELVAPVVQHMAAVWWVACPELLNFYKF